MEFFRWILIFTGAALLALTFLIGRRRVENSEWRDSRRDHDEFDPSADDLSVPIAGRPSKSFVRTSDDNDDDFLSDEELDDVLPPRGEYQSEITGTQVEMGISDGFDELEPKAPVSDSAGRNKSDSVKSFASAVKQASQRSIGAAVSMAAGHSANKRSDDSRNATNSFAEEFEPYADNFVPEEKIVTINVMAPKGQAFYGNDLQSIFRAHDYEFGSMSIYHCNHDGLRVFSVANVVQPGSFDPDEMEMFETPGITLFMRLPVSLDADVAFDFLMREATELADELGGVLKDEDRGTLSKQTIQHMREDILYCWRYLCQLQYRCFSAVD